MMKKPLILLYLSIISLHICGQQKPLFDVAISKSDSSDKLLQEVRQQILDHYYYDGITENDLNWAAIEGMLQHISPPESPNLARLWTDEEYEKILNSLKGIKVTMGFKSNFNSSDGSLTVTSLIEESEAEKQLKINDRILRIDNQVLKGMSTSEVNKLLDGELGQKSILKVVRDVNVFDVSLTRDSLKVKNLIVTEIPNKPVALIELKKVTVGLANELGGALSALQSKGIENIILDLRNNVGGVLNEGINIARLFMKKDEIVLRTQSRSNGIKNYAASKDQFHHLSVIILVNEKTASASEIIAYALKDQGRGILVGKKTYGKGVIETTFTLENGYRLKFITNAMYSPKGKSWQSKGILPDYFIDQTKDNYNQTSKMDITRRIQYDLHLSTALRLLD